MSGTRFYRSWRGRLPLLATFMILIALVVAPSVSARAAVKQYLSKITPLGVSGGTTTRPFTVTLTDCGGAPLESPCTASSTIQLGSAQILVPTRFSNVTFVSATSPNGRNWTGIWDGTYIQGWAVNGTDKLNAGDKVNLNFTADVSGCQTGSYEFTTTAWGSTPTHMGETFSPLPPQPSVSVNGCNLAPGENATGPNGTNVTNNSDVTVGISFGPGDLTCSGAQWNSYHLPDEVNIIPPTEVGSTAKTFAFEFDQSIFGGDSSWYLICYQSNIPFTDRSGNTVTTGLLPACYDPATNETRPVPCVSEQFLTTGSGAPPWTVSASKVHISIRVPAADPRAH
jgi:hypothetical protein